MKDDVAGQKADDTHRGRASNRRRRGRAQSDAQFDAASPPPLSVDQIPSDARSHRVDANGGDPCHPASDVQVDCAAISTTIQHICINYPRYRMWLRAQSRLTLQIKARCRRYCNGDRDLADEMYKRLLKGAEFHEGAIADTAPLFAARHIITESIKPVERELVRLYRTLPIAEFQFTGFKPDGTSGFSVVGECGNLWNYPTVSKLWKRMGLAVIDGKRQQRIKNNPELAIIHGFDPQRRAAAWNIGANGLLKHKAKNKYGAIYEARRAHTAITHPDWPKKHSHDDAMRIITKAFLKDYWIEWRKRTPNVSGENNLGGEP